MGGEEPLQGQLVHADRRGEHVGADVGDVEPLQQPLDAAVLAEGAVQGREDGVGAEQPGARRPARPRPPAWLQPPSRAIVTSTTSWPAARRPRATAAPERSETSCSEERPPLRTATLIGSSRFRRAPRACLPTTIVTSAPGSSFGARRRELVDHAADFAGDFGFFFFDDRAEAGFAHRLHRFGAQLADHVRDLGLLLAGGDDDRRRVEPAFDLAAGARATGGSPRRPGESLSSSETTGTRPRPRICCTATRRWLPTRTGTLTSFGPAETNRVTVEPLVARFARRRVRSGSPAPSSTESELSRFRRRRRSPPLPAFRSPLRASSPAVAGHLAAAGPGADGQRHRRLRAEEGEEGAVERRPRRPAARPAGPARAPCSAALRARPGRLRRPRSRSCSSSAIATLSCLPVTFGTSVVGVAGQRRGRSAAPIRTAAIAATIQRRRRLLRLLLVGLLLAARRDDRRQRREGRRCRRRRPVPSSPRRGRR